MASRGWPQEGQDADTASWVLLLPDRDHPNIVPMSGVGTKRILSGVLPRTAGSDGETGGEHSG
jgi:hypothetical protein